MLMSCGNNKAQVSGLEVKEQSLINAEAIIKPEEIMQTTKQETTTEEIPETTEQETTTEEMTERLTEAVTEHETRLVTVTKNNGTN